MTCDELLKLKELQGELKVVGGEAGLYRNISWIYFIERDSNIDEEDYPLNRINGGELMAATTSLLKGNEAKIDEFMRIANEKKAAGFIINIGEGTESLIACANELQLPLIEMSWDLRMVDLSQVLCKRLIEEESMTHSFERILTMILYDKNLTSEEIIYQCEKFDVDVSKEYFFINIQEKSENNSIRRLSDNLMKSIIREFRLNNYKIMTLLQRDSIVALVPSLSLDREKMNTIGINIIEKAKQTLGISLIIGVGQSYGYMDEWRLSYQEAKKALLLTEVLNKDLIFYNDIDIYALFMQINNDKFLDSYYTNLLKPLIDLDEMSNGSLCETLEVFLNCHCNMNEAAEALFIHRNTMRYRIDKIKNVLKCNFNNVNTSSELYLAYCIKKYRTYSK